MRLCGLLWLPSFLLCAAVAAKELINSDSALMRGDYGAAVEILQNRVCRKQTAFGEINMCTVCNRKKPDRRPGDSRYK